MIFKKENQNFNRGECLGSPQGGYGPGYQISVDTDVMARCHSDSISESTFAM